MTIKLPGTAQVDAASLGPAACLFKSFADPNRLVIAHHLLLGEHRVVDLVEHLGLAQSTVSAHIGCLRDCGLLSARVRGRATYYSLAEPDLTRALLGSAEALLGATGDAVALCPTSGVGAGVRDELQP